MQKVKFDFEAIKENIFVKQSANVPVGAPVDENGNVANDGTAHGIVICAKKQAVAGRFVKNLTVMVGGYVDTIDAQLIWGDEYSAEAMAAMSDIVFCENHMIPGGSDPVLANAKATGGFGWMGLAYNPIEWDGDISNKHKFTLEDGSAFYLVSDQTPTLEEFVGSDIEFGEEYTEVHDFDTIMGGDCVFFMGDIPVLIAPFDGAYFELSDEEEPISVTIDKKGVYLLGPETIGEEKFPVVIYPKEEIHKISGVYVDNPLSEFLFVNVDTSGEVIAINHTYDEIQNANRVFAVVDDRTAQVYMTGGLVAFLSLASIEQSVLSYRIVFMPEDRDPYIEEKDVPFE